MTADPRDLHIPMTTEHLDRYWHLCCVIESCIISAKEAAYRSSYPLALHHVGEARDALVRLIPIAKRFSDHAVRSRAGSEAA